MHRFCLDVSGEFACFSRPEMKVERVSYDVMTPSAARAIYEAILWKPAIAWHIEKIEVLTPIAWCSVRRNEVASVLSSRNVATAMHGGAMPALFIEEERQQRAALILKHVRYRIHAHFTMTHKAGAEDNPAKFAAMFERRAKMGQSFHQPYLGCREFACAFHLVEDAMPEPAAIQESRDLGWMLYDMDFTQQPPTPRFFRASMVDGVVQVMGQEIRG